MAQWPSRQSTAGPHPQTNATAQPQQEPLTQPSNKPAELFQLWQKMLNANRASMTMLNIQLNHIDNLPTKNESDEPRFLSV